MRSHLTRKRSHSGKWLKWMIEITQRTTPMTTNADDVWRLLGELIEAQKETERLLKEQSQESDRRFREQSQESDSRSETLRERRFRET
ncbi:MAG: hypothetical protein P5674_25840, partial [Limnospira sp. PMC 289.06]|nr:hypothetical protein [Limnospira sp. PMC 289.06]